jgi:hypothetical protein
LVGRPGDTATAQAGRARSSRFLSFEPLIDGPHLSVVSSSSSRSRVGLEVRSFNRLRSQIFGFLSKIGDVAL